MASYRAFELPEIPLSRLFIINRQALSLPPMSLFNRLDPTRKHAIIPHVTLSLQISADAVDGPQRHKIRRSGNGRVDDVVVPDQVWVLKLGGSLQPFEPIMSEVEEILIRAEYQDIANAIIAWILKQNEISDEWSKEEQKGVSGSVEPEELEATMEVDIDIKQEEEEYPVGYIPQPGDIYVKPDPNFHSYSTYCNPFQKYPNITENAGMALTGTPGIGKTLFLVYLWRIRCILNLPTFFMFIPDIGYLWFDNTVYTIQVKQIGNDLNSLLPEYTWCLVDSNISLGEIPPNLRSIKHFVIQAASPRDERMKWVEKSSVAEYLVMRSWKFVELIIGVQLQDRKVRSLVTETMVHQFYSKYGGSARDVYRYLKRQGEMEQRITRAMNKMTPKTIRTACHSDPASPKDADHILLSLLPLHDFDRRVFVISSPTPYTQSKVIQRLNDDVFKARSELYKMFLSVRYPGTQTVAGYYFDNHYHYAVALGGVWRLRKMSPSQAHKATQTYSCSASTLETDALIVDQSMKVLLLPDAPNPRQGAEPLHLPIPILEFNKDALVAPLETNCYYLPRDRAFPMMDSFYTDKPGHAIVFQATVLEQHDAKSEGRIWLNNHGILKITYIYLTPPTVTEPKVYIPLETVGMIDNAFHMQLEMVHPAASSHLQL